MTNITAIVTGASDGVGKEVARRLAMTGANVILHGRNRQKTEAVRDEIAAQASGKLDVIIADFASLAEVRQMADTLNTAYPSLNLLINNAGIGIADGRREESKDGYELRFAVNYLSPFLLTRLLLQKITASAPARIVNVSSAGQAAVNFDDVMQTQGYSGAHAYCQSKLAQIMFTIDLATELSEQQVSVTALHPATYMNTKIVEMPLSTVEDGADAIMNLATAAQTDGLTGVYFNQLHETQAHPQAYDAQAREQLKELSLRLTGLDNR